jgi:TatD DNase family protein
MMLIDSHCHLYSQEFKDDIDEVIQRATHEGVEKFFLPAIDSNSLEAMLLMEEKYPGKCVAMMGLHPCSVKNNYKEELAIAENWLQKRKFVAIGEIGLDFYWDTTFAKEQLEAFRIQIEWALYYKLPIVIHTRNAMQETINIIKEYLPKGIKGIFHCFSGSYENAKEIIDAGFYLGIGGIVTYKNSGIAEVLAKTDLKHLVLETDSPYLSPVPYRGKRNESSYLKYIAKRVAEIKAVSVDEVANITTANTQKIFGC